jgi:hypothetical protein
MSPSSRLGIFVVLGALGSACGKTASSTPAKGDGGTDGDGGGDGGAGILLPLPRTSSRAVTKVDLLVMVDNSASMGDKQAELARRIPSLVKALTNPDLDPATGRPRTLAVTDVHVGIITSSLGSHGTSACDSTTYPHSDDHGHLMPRAGENGSTGYTLDSVGGAPTEAPCPGTPIAASALTWAFDPAKGAQYTGLAGVKGMETSVSCIVQSAKEDGCGYEAQLESIYHFLIDPAPYLSADHGGAHSCLSVENLANNSAIGDEVGHAARHRPAASQASSVGDRSAGFA